jgi:hypothetical protein
VVGGHQSFAWGVGDQRMQQPCGVGAPQRARGVGAEGRLGSVAGQQQRLRAVVQLPGSVGKGTLPCNPVH